MCQLASSILPYLISEAAIHYALPTSECNHFQKIILSICLHAQVEEQCEQVLAIHREGSFGNDKHLEWEPIVRFPSAVRARA